MICSFYNYIKSFLYFSLIIIYFQDNFYNDVLAQDTKTNILTINDINLYKKIFYIQSLPIRNRNASEWKKIELLKSKVQNPILFGTISAKKYLHPTGWRSSFIELKNWLKLYNDHPDAYKIYRLAKRRKPKKDKLPIQPSGDYLNGYGNILRDLIKPVFPLSCCI